MMAFMLDVIAWWDLPEAIVQKECRVNAGSDSNSPNLASYSLTRSRPFNQTVRTSTHVWIPTSMSRSRRRGGRPAVMSTSHGSIVMGEDTNVCLGIEVLTCGCPEAGDLDLVLVDVARDVIALLPRDAIGGTRQASQVLTVTLSANGAEGQWFRWPLCLSVIAGFAPACGPGATPAAGLQQFEVLLWDSRHQKCSPSLGIPQPQVPGKAVRTRDPKPLAPLLDLSCQISRRYGWHQWWHTTKKNDQRSNLSQTWQQVWSLKTCQVSWHMIDPSQPTILNM